MQRLAPGLLSYLPAVAVVALVSFSACTAPDEIPVGSNILLVTIDTLRADHLSSYGYQRATSPVIDKLAAEGIRFDQVSVQWPKTGPSFASIFTATYPKNNGIVRRIGIPLPDDFLMLAELLQARGYGTHAVVSNGAVASELNFNQGFDVYLETWKGREEVPESERDRGDVVTLLARQAAGGQVPGCGAVGESPEAVDSSCCGPQDCCGGGDGSATATATRDVITADLYEVGETSELPDAAVLASLGCGNPTALAQLSAGEVVLDLGSGGGIDVLLSARRVGPTGKAYGLDMTDEMLDLAEQNRQEAGIENAEFLKGEIEDIPLPESSVDVRE